MNKLIIFTVAIIIAIFVVIVALNEVPKKHTFLETGTETTEQTTTEAETN